MKRFKIFLVFIALATLIGCRSQKEAEIVESTDPVVTEEVEEEKLAPKKPKVETPAVEINKPTETEISRIPSREEMVSFELLNEREKSDHEGNTYFVITGSFRHEENAQRFMSQLEGQGFEPFTLLAEAGFHRVCVDSYNDETVARERIFNIRNSFDEYSDTWLLIKK